MKRKVHVIGVGMIPFAKPGASEHYHVMARGRARRRSTTPVSTTGSCSRPTRATSTATPPSGQAAVYGVGLTGIPVFNVNNNCSTGSSALFLARQAVESGMVECVLALGFEQMEPGALKSAWTDRPSPMDRFGDAMNELQGLDDAAPRAAQLFGGAGRDYLEQHGTARETFAKHLGEGAPARGAQPARAVPQHRDARRSAGLAEVFDPLTRLQCCPPTCGAAAAVLCSDEFARKHGLDARVHIAAQAMTTDTPSTFDADDMSTWSATT